MNRRSVFAGLAIVAAVAVAVPAVAQDIQGPNPLATNIKRVGDEARNLAHKAIKKANKALRKSRKATQLAIAAGSGVGTPGATGATGPTGIGNTPFFAEAPGAVTTADDTQFVQLPGGPSVTLNVPHSANAPAGTGFIQVTASSIIGDEAGAVALHEDGASMPGQSEQCEQGLGLPEAPLFASLDGLGGPYGTPGTLDPITIMCANTGAPGPVTFVTSTGTHTYELLYNYCGCSGTEATFSERRLWVTPLG